MPQQTMPQQTMPQETMPQETMPQETIEQNTKSVRATIVQGALPGAAHHGDSLAFRAARSNDSPVGRLLASFISGIVLLGCMPVTVLANEFYRISVGAGNEDNVPRVAGSPSAAESGVFTADFTGGKFFQVGLNHSLVLAANMNARRYIEHSGFDTIGASISGSYTYKFGFGAYAPRLGAAVTLGTEAMDGEARDRRFTTTEISIEKRLSPAWLVSAGMDYHDSRGKSLPGDDRLLSFGYDPNATLPYDLFTDDATSLFASASYEFATGVTLTAGYNRSDGFTVSSIEIPELKIYKVSDAVYVDPSWPDLWFAYRLQTTTDDWSVGLSVPMGLDSSINLGASWQDIDGPSDLDYRNRLLSISFVHSF